MQKEHLVDLHFSFGSAIRNAFGFWGTGSPLLTTCQKLSPDDISEQLIHELWKRLNLHQDLAA
jgi:hypothetical protein